MPILRWNSGLRPRTTWSIYRGGLASRSSRAPWVDAPVPTQKALLRTKGPEHHDVATYEAYAAHTGLNTNSTVYVGTHYEYTVAKALEKFGFDLQRIGGRDDVGIDLKGNWTLPIPPETDEKPLRVILQCKASKSYIVKIPPRNARELEGSFSGAPPGFRNHKVVAFLVAPTFASKGILEAFNRSSRSMGFISCSLGGKVQQIIWNYTAEDKLLHQVQALTRFSVKRGKKEQEVFLTWKGKDDNGITSPVNDTQSNSETSPEIESAC